MSNDENPWDVGTALEGVASVMRALDEVKAKRAEENEQTSRYLEGIATEVRRGNVTALFVVTLNDRRVRYGIDAATDDASMRLLVASQAVLTKKIAATVPDSEPVSEGG